jgi:FKBP-type peptidyl-prolyl cis-trans isomerase FkpA
MILKITLLLPFLLQPCFAAEAPLKTEEEKVLYSLGAILGRNLLSLSLTPAELKHVAAGMKDSAAGQKLQTELNVYGPKIEAWAQSRQLIKTESARKKTEPERKKGAAFAAKMAKEKGAAVSPTGLIYLEEKTGSGPGPSSTDTVKVHYQGTLIDGTVFDSSYQRNEPSEFVLNQVIRCWTEGVAKMRPGGKAKLICPSDIAYGDNNVGDKIPGGATLVFAVELLEVKKK